jgi:hypothetical protein
MAGSGVLQVERVEYLSDADAVCIVRCLSGVVRVGDAVRALGPESEGTSDADALIIAELWRYERSVDLVDPPHVAKVKIGGRILSLESGWRLVVKDHV